jgi:type II secretory pathway pseudopilin PulG
MSATELIANFLLASVPGVLIALLAFALQVRRDNQAEVRATRNARQLLSLELEGNRTALKAFWNEINDIDPEHADILSDDHLTAITEGGFLTYPLPHWNTTRWQPATPAWLKLLTEKEIEQVDRIYRDLDTIADLHKRIVTLTPSEQALLDKDRFWASRFASMRNAIFPRLVELVNRTLTAENPLSQMSRGTP